MLKFIGILFAVFVFGAVLYVVHVPVLKYWSTPSANSELTAYVPLSDRIDGETHTIEKIVNGNTLKILFDPDNKTYLIVAEFFENDQNESSGRHIIVLGQNGDLQEIRRIDQDKLELLLNSTTLKPVDPVSERKYAPQFSFEDSKGRIELVHYQFQEFREWPYLYYFIPVIPSDWNGLAFVKINHDGETFRIRVPTEYDGGFLYSLRNIDGQLYLRKRPDETSGIAFLQVDESSYTQNMDGHETHREGYGLYLIRRNKGS